MPLGARLETVPGTRILVETFGLVGSRFTEPKEPARQWTVITTLRPLVTRTDRGTRLRVIDQVGVVSFIDITDYELLSGKAKPGELCCWTSEEYPEVGDEHAGWRGLCMDLMDQEDDLHIRELELRAERGWGVLPELQLTRYLHLSENHDVEQLDMLLMDYNPETGQGPDPRIDTIARRWSQVQQEVIEWDELQ